MQSNWPPFARSTTPLLALVVSCLLTSHAACAGERVRVSVRDGRILTGEVDHRTDDASLWLRFTSPSIVLVSSLPWNDVTRVELDGKQLDGDALRDIARSLATNLPKNHFRQPEDRPNAETMSAPSIANGRLYVVKPMPQRAKVMAVEVEAQVANWDADPQTDGIELRLLPRSSSGQIVPANGHLAITLTGRRYRPTRGQSPVAQLGTWSLPVDAAKFGRDGAVYQLPFRSVWPDQDLSFSASGLIAARLNTPRQGCFEATAPVRLRVYNPLLDEIRFLGQRP